MRGSSCKYFPTKLSLRMTAFTRAFLFDKFAFPTVDRVVKVIEIDGPLSAINFNPDGATLAVGTTRG